MKKSLIFWSMVLLSALLLSACQPAPVTQQPSTEIPAGSKFDYGNAARVESLSVLLLESFPLQARAVITGYLPDGCTEIAEINVENQDGTFLLTITTKKPEGDIACTEAIVPFEESVPLEIAGLKAGTYKVIAQDQSTEFTLDIDNVLATDEPNSVEFSYGSDAHVEEMNVNIMESYPVQVSVNLVGYLPDGCTKIDEITANREEKVYTIEIITKRPSGEIACTMALVPFDVNVPLDVEGLPDGEYVVVVQDLQETFALEMDN